MADVDSPAPAEGRLRRLWAAIVSRPWASWGSARTLAIAVGLLTWAINRGNVFVDITGYGRWAFGALDGSRMPYLDFAWEYPPLALPGIVVPAVITAPLPTWLYLPYAVAWLAMVLALDALIFRTMLHRVGNDVHHPALAVWILGPPLLGALSWTRFDMLAAAAAFAAVLYAGSKRSIVSGLAAGVGANLKLWPSLLAPIQRSRGRAFAATGIALATVVLVAGVTLLLTGSTGFDQVLAYQEDRGLQIESLAALPLVWANHLGVDGFGTRFAFGAFEITGPGVEALATVATILFALGLLAVYLVHWRLMRRDALARGVGLTSVTLLLVILVTNKVFSPQYVLWLVAVVAAAAVLDPETYRRYVTPVLVLCGLTAIVFPLFYGDVLSDAWIGLLAMTARDGVLVWLLVIALIDLLRELKATRRRERGAVQAGSGGVTSAIATDPELDENPRLGRA